LAVPKSPFAVYFSGRLPAKAGPGFPLQFLSPPVAGLRDFRFNPWRMGEQRFCEVKS
jgi:hypothetical protein